MPDDLPTTGTKSRPHAATEYLPPERASNEELQAAIREVANNPILNALLEATDVVPLLLNEHRQVVALNEDAFRRLGGDTTGVLLGLRPGEMMQCAFSRRGPSGCGTGKACQVCGIVGAVLESQETGTTAERESLLSVEDQGWARSMELLVRATPVELGNQRFTMVTLRDLGDRKRRQVLERVFLHDVRNTLTGLYGWSHHLQTRPDQDHDLAVGQIVNLVERLDTEIRYQSDLLEAESGKFEPEWEKVDPAEILDEARGFFERNLHAAGRNLVVESPDGAETFTTDSRLLIRVLTNMLKNAFEATPRGGTITLGFRQEGQDFTFFVSNEGVMPENVAMQVFRRSFSTKAKKGRGLGTYSMKLFGERYLQGRVAFRSTAEAGTRFWITLPREPAKGEPPP